MRVAAYKNMADNLAARVYHRQVGMLYSNQALAVISTAIVVVLFFCYLNSTIPWQDLSGWFSMFICILGLRTLATWLYFRDDKLSAGDARYACWIYLAGVCLTASLWACMVLMMFATVQLDAQILFFTTCIGMAGVSSTTMGYVKTPNKIFNMILVVPLIIVLYGSEFPNWSVIIIGLILYLAFLLRSVHLFANNVEDMMLLQERGAEREQQLMIQSKQAEQANRAKSDFLSRMSHELRTPLNAVLGMNELQMMDRKNPLTEKQVTRSRKINEAGEHLLSLVNDVLDLSRVEAGRLDVAHQSFDCQELVREVLDMTDTNARARDIGLNFESSEKPVWIYADRNRTKQIMINLLDNAVKYNKRGGSVSVSFSGKENRAWRISVIDTGYGISDNMLDDIFVPFSRPHKGYKAIEGTGVGLSLCKQLAIAMNGRIGVNSRQGEGSRFWIELPKAEPQPVTEQLEKFGTYVKAANSQLDDNNLDNFAGKKVLLVEDNEINQEVSTEMLHDMGLQVILVQNGVEAMEILRNNQYDLILMDCEMPLMDGFITTQKIRELEQQRNLTLTPVIALTAHAIQGAREKCLASGMDDYLSKPFSYEGLQYLLNKWLEPVNEKTVGVVDSDVDKQVLKKSMTDLQHADGSSNRTSSIDLNALDRLRMSKAHAKNNLVIKVVNIYLEQSPSVIEKIEHSVMSGDISELDSIAHTFKTSSLTVGAVAVADLCKEMERQYLDGRVDAGLIQQLRQQFEIVSQELAGIVKAEAIS